MKTPREIILDQHREAEARLKAMQPEIIAACARESGNAAITNRNKREKTPSLIARFWFESVLPWRRAWIGMTALWVGIFLLHLSTNEREVVGVASAPETDPQVRIVLLEQKRFLAELLEPPGEPSLRRVTTTGPRSDLRLEQVIV